MAFLVTPIGWGAPRPTWTAPRPAESAPRAVFVMKQVQFVRWPPYPPIFAIFNILELYQGYKIFDIQLLFNLFGRSEPLIHRA